jgi:DNA-binding response OmpR family regulator
MRIKVMIIDEEAQFRALLMHHVTTFWPDAIISAYDPTQAGHLPDEFSGAASDLILLGSSHGERDGIDVLRRFVRRKNFPPVVYFGTEEDQDEAQKLGPDAHFIRNHIKHDSLIVGLSDVLVSRQQNASTSVRWRPARGQTPLHQGLPFHS